MNIKVYRLHDRAVAPRANGPDGKTWELACPVGFEATWNGGPRPEDIEIRIDGASADQPVFVQSRHGHGILTFHSGCQFKTEAPHVLWVGGPLRAPKDGLAPLESLADAALLPCTVAVHWQFTRPNHTVRFAAGEPFARLLLYPKDAPNAATLEIVPRAEDAAAGANAFREMVDTDALGDLFQRLAGTAAATPAADVDAQAVAPAEPARSPSCFETIDGPLDLSRFEAGFFRPEYFYGRPREAYLRRHGEVYRRDYFILDERKLVYLSVPKAACTAIKLALAKVRGIEFDAGDDVEYVVHFHPKWHREGGRLRPAQDGYYRFAFVRNPFDRLVSCYRGKIVFQASPRTRVPLYHDYYFSLPVNVGFADFAERVCKIPDALADSHFKSQASMLYAGDELLVDYLGRFEQFDRDWRPLAERFQLDPLLEQRNVSKHKPGCHSDYRRYYSAPLVQMVYERYRRDVHAFGYEDEYRQLLEFVRQQPQPDAVAAAATDRQDAQHAAKEARP